MSQAPLPFGGIPYIYTEEGDLEISVSLGTLTEMLSDEIISVEDASAILYSQQRSPSEVAEYLSSVAGYTSSKAASSAIGEYVDQVTATVTSSMGDAAQAQSDAIEAVDYELDSGIASSILEVSRTLDELNAFLQAGQQAYYQGLLDVTAASERRIIQAVLVPVSQMTETSESIIGRIKGFIGGSVQAITASQRAETDLIQATVTQAGDALQEELDEVVDAATGFATALREAIPSLGAVITGALESAQDFVVDGIKDAASSILSSFFDGIGADAVERIEPIIAMFEEELNTSPELRRLTAPGLLPAVGVGALAAGFALPMILSSVASTMLSPFAEKLRQRMNALSRPTLMSPGEAVQSEQRGMMASQLAQNILDRQGLPDDQADALRELVMQRPGTIEVIDYWRRELMTDQEADQALYRLGWNDDYRELLREAAYPPPGVGDLITMAVREVFSPEVAERFGQFDEIPDAYIMWAKRVGLNDYWARNYWAAHWSLPSIMQGFEMLHRDVITSDDLDRLFVALDVMPFWRDNIKAISYAPFTRVDVRRMNAFGILGPEEVKRSYLDIGYDDEKAQALTDFTIAYNQSTKKVEKTRERDLTKGDIIGMYNDGVIDAKVTHDYLIQLGYDEDEAEVLIEREDVQEMRRERKADIANVIDQARIKALTYEEAQDRLAALDLTRTETNKALSDLSRISQTRTRTPSKTDLDDWLDLALITAGDYAEELRTLGYAERYVQLYVEATTAEAEADILAQEDQASKRREPRSVSKGNLDSLYQAEIIDADEYNTGLITLGYREPDIVNLLAQQTIKLEEKRLEEIARLARGEEAAPTERMPSRALLGKLYLKALISIEAYRDGLVVLGFSPENVELLAKLIGAKAEENASKSEGST